MKFGDVDSGHLDSVPAEGHVGVQERQREPLQIEPVESFGIAGIQAMPLDAMLSELAQVPVAENYSAACPNHNRAYHNERESWYVEAVWERS